MAEQLSRPLTGRHQDTDVHIVAPANAAVVVSFDDEQAYDFSIITYWHKPEHGQPYIVVEIEDLTAEVPSGEPPTPVRVRHNEAVVYDWRVEREQG